MSGAVAISLPAAKLLPTWWRELTRSTVRQGRRMWFAHPLLHRVELAVESIDDTPAMALACALLDRLATLPQASQGISADQLGSATSLDPPLRDELLQELRKRGVLAESDGLIRIVPEAERPPPPPTRRRRILHFCAASPPTWLPLNGDAVTALTPQEDWSFDPGAVQSAIAQPPAWKRRNRFPEDIVRYVPMTAGDPRTIVLVQPVQALLVLVETERAILGFSVHSEQWTLDTTPVLSVAPSAEVMSDLMEEPPIDAWKRSWAAWCQQRSLPASEVETCTLERHDYKLVVRAPGRLLDRLRQGRNEFARGEVWVMAGAGRSRAAAQVEIG